MAAHLTGEVDIRRARPDDAEIVMGMVREIAAHEGHLAQLTVTTQRWAHMLTRDDVIVLIAWHGRSALGYVSAVRRIHLWSDADVLGLDDLYVREAARDRGIGRVLMTTLAAEFALPDGLTVVWGVEPDNEAGQRFYRRLGATLRSKVVAGWSVDAYSHTIAGTGV